MTDDDPGSPAGERPMPVERFLQRQLRMLARASLFAFWSLALWGSLLLLALAWTVIERGPAAALEVASLLSWPNLLFVVLAILAWGTVVGAIWSRRRARTPSV